MMSEEETKELIEFLNNMSEKDFSKMLDSVEKEILTEDTYKELKEKEGDKNE